MADNEQMYRHPVTNRVRRSDNPTYMERAGFELYDGEIEIDKTGIKTADMSLAELRTTAEAAGVSKSGTKDEIQSRLAEKAAEPSGDTKTTSASAGDTK